MRRRELLAVLVLVSALPDRLPAAEEKKKKQSGGADYIPLSPLTGTTNRSSGRHGVLSVDCGLQVSDVKLRDYTDKSLPRLRAAYVQVVQIYAAGLPSGSEPDTEFLAQALQRQTDLILKRPGARLLLGAVVVN